MATGTQGEVRDEAKRVVAAEPEITMEAFGNLAFHNV